MNSDPLASGEMEINNNKYNYDKLNFQVALTAVKMGCYLLSLTLLFEVLSCEAEMLE